MICDAQDLGDDKVRNFWGFLEIGSSGGVEINKCRGE